MSIIRLRAAGQVLSGDDIEGQLKSLDEAYENGEEWVPDDVTLWMPFEHDSLSSVMDNIDNYEHDFKSLVKEVLNETRKHLVNLATEDKLPLDLTALDLSPIEKFYNE